MKCFSLNGNPRCCSRANKCEIQNDAATSKRTLIRLIVAAFLLTAAPTMAQQDMSPEERYTLFDNRAGPLLEEVRAVAAIHACGFVDAQLAGLAEGSAGQQLSNMAAMLAVPYDRYGKRYDAAKAEGSHMATLAFCRAMGSDPANLAELKLGLQQLAFSR